MLKLCALLAVLGCAAVGACGGHAGSFDDGSTRRLNPENVPAELRHLIPLAERWGIGDDVDRNEKVEAATPAERDELRAAVAPHDARITAWLDSFREGTMSDEAAAFMYTQLAIEEMAPVAR